MQRGCELEDRIFLRGHVGLRDLIHMHSPINTKPVHVMYKQTTQSHDICMVLCAIVLIDMHGV